MCIILESQAMGQNSLLRFLTADRSNTELRNNFDVLRKEVNELRENFDGLRKEVTKLCGDFNSLVVELLGEHKAE